VIIAQKQKAWRPLEINFKILYHKFNYSGACLPTGR